MNSKKGIWDYRVAIKTYKNFKIPKEFRDSHSHCSPAVRKMITRANKKRARRFYKQYIDVL